MKLQFRRQSVRGQSGLMSVTATRAAMEAAHRRMLSAAWTPCEGTASDLPPHKYEQRGVRDEFDAFCFGGDYVADDEQCSQRAYCGAIAYTAPVPPDALADCTLSSVALRAYGDRWLAQGAVLDVYLTASATPPAFADIEAGTELPLATTGTPAAAGAQNPAYPAPFQCVARSNSGSDSAATVTVSVGAALSVSTRYLHLVLRLGDYEHVSLTDTGAVSTWIEGGAALSADSIEVAFSRAVAPAAVGPDEYFRTLASFPEWSAGVGSWTHVVEEQEGEEEQEGQIPVFEGLSYADMAMGVAYAYRPFVFDIGKESGRDVFRHFAFPMAGAVRATATAAGYAADMARPFVAPDIGCVCGHAGPIRWLFNNKVDGSNVADVTSLCVTKCAVSGVQVLPFATGSRRYRSATVLFYAGENFTHQVRENYAVIKKGFGEGYSATVRVCLYALPWPLLVFTRGAAADPGYMAFARVLDLSTLCAPDFLAGAATGVSFIDDHAFFGNGILEETGATFYPLYRQLDGGAGETEHQLFHSTVFPCVPVATGEFTFSGGDGTSPIRRTLSFPSPLDTPDKTVFLMHVVPVSEEVYVNPSTHQPVDFQGGWDVEAYLESISE